MAKNNQSNRIKICCIFLACCLCSSCATSVGIATAVATSATLKVGTAIVKAPFKLVGMVRNDDEEKKEENNE